MKMTWNLATWQLKKSWKLNLIPRYLYTVEKCAKFSTTTHKIAMFSLMYEFITNVNFLLECPCSGVLYVVWPSEYPVWSTWKIVYCSGIEPVTFDMRLSRKRHEFDFYRGHEILRCVIIIFRVMLLKVHEPELSHPLPPYCWLFTLVYGGHFALSLFSTWRICSREQTKN